MLGKHVLVDFYGVESDLLKDAQLLSEKMQIAAKIAGLTALIPPTLHIFPGGGVTGFLLLQESHIALHTYPEFGYIALDIFSCGPADPFLALDILRQALHPDREDVSTRSRGAGLLL